VSQVVQVLDLPQLGAFMRTRREDLDRKRHDRLPADAVTYCRLFHMGSGRQSRERMGALPPRYSFVLNPYTSERFTKCPSCETPTRIRKLPTSHSCRAGLLANSVQAPQLAFEAVRLELDLTQQS
jgi:hypothetical protein